MRRIAGIIIAVALCLSSIVAWADNENSKGIIVEIDYGRLRPSRTIEAPLAKDRTILEVLQSVATVETHPVGKYVMVTSIDGVKGKRGEMAWYYTIDGKSADKIAYSKVADSAKHIKWVYKKDVCSPKVDCLNTAKKED
ncbi:MAG: DUF4430 domain-containing protein [Candidatus Omnitrophota bacterium]|nr:MAG: DUF4430 domain-containing protein [Candidatus Omnitrophota bacterium]